MHWIRLTVPLVLAAHVLVGCSSGIDTGDIESEIERHYLDPGGGLQGFIVEVVCPDDIPVLLGYEAECEMVYDAGGRITPVYVTVMNLDGDLEWSITSRTPTGGDRVTGNDGQSPTFGE